MIRYLVILALFIPLTSPAKKEGMALADSLISALHSSRYRDKVDTTTAKLLAYIATAYYAVPDSSIKYANLVAQMSQKLGWEHGIAIAYTSLCYDYSAKSDFATAIGYGKRALAINEKQGKKKDAISSLGNIANCYIAQGDYKEAVDFLLKALTLAEEVNDKELSGLVLQSLGITYDQLKNYSRSKQYYLDALKLFEQVNDKNSTAVVLTNLAGNYEHEHNDAAALSTVLRAIKMFEELGNQYAVMVSIGVAGGCYRNLHNYPRALLSYREGQRLSRELGSMEYTASSYKGLGETFLAMARDTTAQVAHKVTSRKYLDSAVIYLEKAASEGTKVNVSDVVAEIHQGLSDAYTLRGDYKAALEHQRAYDIARDSMYSTDNRLKIASLETKREADLKNKQIELNKLATIKKRNEQGLLIGGLVVLFIAIITVLRAHDKQKRANGEKEVLLRQKDMLMKEIHHRVKNNLQVISALLDLQLQNITDEHAKGAMAESTTRVRSISLIHQQLYQHDDITSIEFSRFAEDLVNQVTAVFKKGGQEIVFHNNITSAELDIDTAVPLGLILNELVTNSFKYAFGSGGGAINVALEKAAGSYMLNYSDSGPGLPQNGAAASSGLGMRMIRSLSKQIGGRFTYDGSTRQITITFKDTAARKLID